MLPVLLHPLSVCMTHYKGSQSGMTLYLSVKVNCHSVLKYCDKVCVLNLYGFTFKGSNFPVSNFIPHSSHKLCLGGYTVLMVCPFAFHLQHIRSLNEICET